MCRINGVLTDANDSDVGRGELGSDILESGHFLYAGRTLSASDVDKGDEVGTKEIIAENIDSVQCGGFKVDMADDTESRCGGCRSEYRFGEDVPGRQVSTRTKPCSPFSQTIYAQFRS